VSAVIFSNACSIAKLNRVMISFSLVIDEKVAPSFGQFLLGKMDSLFEEFNRQNSK